MAQRPRSVSSRKAESDQAAGGGSRPRSARPPRAKVGGRHVFAARPGQLIESRGADAFRGGQLLVQRLGFVRDPHWAMVPALGIVEVREPCRVPFQAAHCRRRRRRRAKARGSNCSTARLPGHWSKICFIRRKWTAVTFEGVFVAAIAARPLEHAHGDFVRRAQQKQARRPEPGKVL